MFKQEELLTITPQHELKFCGPFNSPSSSWITLANNTDKKVCFKLKTTVPKRYCVRPNSGVLPARATIEVHVLLQPFAFNPLEKNKHKFMIQTVQIPDSMSNMSPEEVWKSVDVEKLTNYKLKCVFELDPEPEAEQEQSVEPVNQSSPPKAPLPGLGGELQKAATEVIQLREEENKLRQENISLKEQIAKLRHEENMRHSYSPPAVQQTQFAQGPVPTYYIVISIAVAFLALLFGKYAL